MKICTLEGWHLPPPVWGLLEILERRPLPSPLQRKGSGRGSGGRGGRGGEEGGSGKRGGDEGVGRGRVGEGRGVEGGWGEKEGV